MMQTILKPEAMMIVRSQNRTKPVPKGNGDCLSQESLRLGILNGNRSELRAPKTGMSRNCRTHPCRLNQPIDMDASLFEPSWRAAERYSLRRRQREFFKQGAANSGTDWRRSVLLRGVRNGRSSPAEGRFQAMAR
jgi:hypothetical protein